MKLDYRINISDVNSDYINQQAAKYKNDRPSGLSIIQWTEDMNHHVAMNMKRMKRCTNAELIIASRSDAVQEAVHEAEQKNIILANSIEQAKLYVKFGHYILLDAHQTLGIPEDCSFSWQPDDTVLCRMDDAVSLNGRIYQAFFNAFDTEQTQIDQVSSIDKIVWENVLILPSGTLYSHIYDDALPFAANVWLHQIFSIVSHTGEVIKCDTISVCGLMRRMASLDSPQTVRILAHIDRKLNQRYDGRATDVLEDFNRQFTVMLKMRVDKGEVSKQEMVRALEQNGIRHIHYSVLNRGDAGKLVLAYCFPPYNDTSGNVMAKRVQADGLLVDVISNSMDRIRKRDDKLLNLTSNLLDTQVMLDGPQAFSSWASIERYMEDGFAEYRKYAYKYNELYSRAMFPHSHFLGYRIKMENPTLKWTAEFSDPLHKDVKAELRYAPVEDEGFLESLLESLEEQYHHLINDNVFNLCEILPFIYADEIIFTNRFQMEYMLERFEDALQETVRAKAVISQHPVPGKSYYSLVQSYYKIEDTTINLAYFGNFYDTRGFRQIELVAQQLYKRNINNFVIHVFTNMNRNTMQLYQASEYRHYIRMNPYVSYFEFLNMADKMDILMIFDAQTIGIKPFNPYVPSKLSDYRGSDSLVWAFTEPGSILDETAEDKVITTGQLDYHEYSDDFAAMAEQLGKVLYRVSRIECMTD
ncbi:hypothetical protein FO441_00795 [Salinicoccus cyprini]|uniref:Uncharacterized protein n=1 Tax=Salinicoccus cyprini TaxID=2493691 RepID=A0A558AX71_9STAP|nr:hypothetical protein [Salinicoccus cyprini]TVT28849.1 hypothetical protein FO441_00795 [Salinicoccus cyprini]